MLQGQNAVTPNSQNLSVATQICYTPCLNWCSLLRVEKILHHRKIVNKRLRLSFFHLLDHEKIPRLPSLSLVSLLLNIMTDE